MKLAISNIGWSYDNDNQIYEKDSLNKIEKVINAIIPRKMMDEKSVCGLT